MTDEQIEKALEHCSILDTSMESCQGCPLDGLDYCITKLAKDALALIKQQREEIAIARAEAIRVFAERLYAKEDKAACSVSVYDINDTVKELTEELACDRLTQTL